MAHVVGGRAARRGVAPGCPEVRELIGRVGELAELAGAWAGAGTGKPATWLLAGEGGIGKTRLAAELATIAESDGGARPAGPVSRQRAVAVPATAGRRDRRSAGRAVCRAGCVSLPGRGRGRWPALLPELAEVLGPVAAAAGQSGGGAAPRLRGGDGGAARPGGAAARPAGARRPAQRGSGHRRAAALPGPAAAPGRGCWCWRPSGAEEGEAALDALADGHHGWTSARCPRTRWPGWPPTPAGRSWPRRSCAAPAGTPCSWWRPCAGSPPGGPRRAGVVAGGGAGPAASGRRRPSRSCCGPVRCSAPRWTRPSSPAMLDLAPHAAALRCERAAAARLLVVGRAGSYEFANDLIQEVLYATTPAPTRIAHHLRAADLLAATRKRSPRTPRAAAGLAAGRARLPAAGERAMDAVRHRRRRGAARPRAAPLPSKPRTPSSIARAYLARGRAREALGSFRAAFGDHQAAAATARQAGDRRLEMLALRELGGHTARSLGVAMDECADRLCAGAADRRGARRPGRRRPIPGLAGGVGEQPAAVRRGGRARAREPSSRAARPATDRALAAGLDGLKNAYAYLGESEPLREVLDELEPLCGGSGTRSCCCGRCSRRRCPTIGRADWASRRGADRRGDRLGQSATVT